MEDTGVDTRVRLLRPGLAIILVVVGVSGAAHLGWWLLRWACGLLAGLAGVICFAQTVDGALSGREPGSECDRPKAQRPRRVPVRFGLSTLLLAVTVTGVFLGLSRWTRRYFCIVVYDGYVYGFPLRCVYVSNAGIAVGVDWGRLAADIAMGFLLVLGIAMEVESFRSRRPLVEAPRDNQPSGAE